jgi:hypothetical protein
MKQQIAIFRFTLAPHQSIGPTQLQALWATACQTPQVSVGRTAESRPVYSLYASQRLENLPQVEARLRQLLDDRKLHASLIALHTV